jgi:uncharacterized protein (DUF952 family)
MKNTVEPGIVHVYHFADPLAWKDAQRSGAYSPEGLRSEGFIHAATREQIAGVVDRHLRGHGPRVQLTLDVAALGDVLQWEWSNASGDLYPHVFGPIPLSAVVASAPFDPEQA